MSDDNKTHQTLGQELELFMFHELSPGSCFFLPNGTWMLNQLAEYLRGEYRKLGYQEVDTPNIFHHHLWKKSGHWDHYRDHMFTFSVKDNDAEDPEKVADHTYSLKPMNCPSHCLIFQHRNRSYRELPWRIADFGVLHRNELSGSLSGLTRVRKFRQDDAHIFCTHEQIREEVKSNLQLLDRTYQMLGFEYRVTLSTRPDKFMGELEKWEEAERQLVSVIEELEIPYTVNDRDGAFYGPKIDIMVQDALKREHQCGTIQLDFQLPESFQLKYNNGENEAGEPQYAQPVMIHRAMYGSFERFFAVILEHFQGKMPLWLSPRQVKIIPINLKDPVIDYGKKLVDELRAQDFRAELDDSTNKLNYKIRQAEVEKYSCILVIGNREAESGTVNHRKGKKMTEKEWPEVLQQLKVWRQNRLLDDFELPELELK